MAKIDTEMSFTLRIGPASSNQFVKLTSAIREIDTDISIEEQMSKVTEVLPVIFEKLIKEMEAKAEYALGYKLKD